MLRKTTSPGSSPSNDVMVQSLQDTVENLKAENEALLTEKAVLDAALEKMVHTASVHVCHMQLVFSRGYTHHMPIVFSLSVC